MHFILTGRNIVRNSEAKAERIGIFGLKLCRGDNDSLRTQAGMRKEETAGPI